jgi:hypothetical protein
MSKTDAQRAMREARYARINTSAPSRAGAGSAPATPSTPAVRAPKTSAGTMKTDPAPEDGRTCGHRSMNGRVCTREAAHVEKNHRYS